MNSISIKSFIIITMLFLIFLEGVVFYSFFKDTKKVINELLIQNTQSDILNLKHYLQKNLEQNNINKLVSHIDNFIAIDPIMNDIHIFDNNKKLIYDTDFQFGTMSYHSTKNCIALSKITTADLFAQECFSFSVKIYSGLTPKYYNAYIYLNNKYIYSLIMKELKKSILLFIITTLVFSLLLWIFFRSYVISPLEKLRQYAYYSENAPKKIFIQELESIRYSLTMTFDRLSKEQEKLYNLSTKDPLSGLYNRLSLIEKLNWLISRGERENSKFAIIFLDLDNFKNINDSKGHEFGDKVLLYISKILLKITRNNDIVSRLGGDEFVIVLPEYENESKIIEVAQRVQKKLSEPFRITDEEYHVTASMGIAIYPKDGKDVKTLLKNADIAMYKAKELGKNNYQFFTDTMNQIVQERIQITTMIRNALQNNNFILFYQPKVNIQTNKIVGCEALVRLIDPVEGVIPPYKFIPIAEENLAIIPLGEWIIKEAVSQIKKWENTPLKNLKISINLSGVQFKDPKLFEKIEKFTQDTDRSKLDIELTESVLIENFKERLNVIKNIKKFGISLSLDDFGTGYSSLSYLKDIPFDTIKIDKTFIDNIFTKDDLTFVNMIIDISDDLGLNVIAEGVETEKQLTMLKELHCEQYQGYLCSKPLLPQEFEELFIKN